MTKSLVALVGMKHRGTEALVASLPAGEPLELRREPTNEHDPFAIQVWLWAADKHLGFIKATQARALALRMDRNLAPGAPLMAKLAIKDGKWPMVEVDF